MRITSSELYGHLPKVSSKVAQRNRYLLGMLNDTLSSHCTQFSLSPPDADSPGKHRSTHWAWQWTPRYTGHREHNGGQRTLERHCQWTSGALPDLSHVRQSWLEWFPMFQLHKQLLVSQLCWICVYDLKDSFDDRQIFFSVFKAPADIFIIQSKGSRIKVTADSHI